MTVNYVTTQRELAFSTDELFKNIPISLSSTLNTTQTYDYDKDCFFIQCAENSKDFYIDEKIESISSFYKELREKISYVNEEILYSWFSSTSKPINDLFISKSLLNKYYVPSEIQKVCIDLGIEKYLIKAIDLIKKHFPTFLDINISLEKDREIDEEWIALDVTIEGEIEEVLDKYDKYTENLVYEIPWPERDRIRFIYNIV